MIVDNIELRNKMKIEHDKLHKIQDISSIGVILDSKTDNNPTGISEVYYTNYNVSFSDCFDNDIKTNDVNWDNFNNSKCTLIPQ